MAGEVAEALQAQPVGRLAALRRLEGAIDAATMRSLNRLVDGERLSPAAAARRFVPLASSR